MNTSVCAIFAMCAATASNAREDSVLDHMHDHYKAVVKIQSAVIAGSLEDTREPARWLLEHDAPAGLPGSWDVHVDAMRSAAREALEAEDLETAASATANLGLACGGCHVANDVSVEFREVRRPSDNEKSRAHMQRHQWAADRMWEGLIGPSNMWWSRGANLLFEAPLKPHDLGDETGDDVTLVMARRIHQLAANATAVTDINEKAEIYAEFLANCAVCHQALDEGPGR